MVTMLPFKAIMPTKQLAAHVAALPYDVYNRKESKEVVGLNPLSFLQIDRGETLLDETVDIHDDIVYKTAASRLSDMIKEGKLVQDEGEAYYVYELERLGKIQQGLVCLVSAKEYEQGLVKKHENTRVDKEKDRIRHIEALNAHTGPIFLTYKNTKNIQNNLSSCAANGEVVFEFTADDGIRHKGIKVLKEDENLVKAISQSINTLYIADGHHRAASASKVAAKRNYEGESGNFIGVAFPSEQLTILDYNRIVSDLNNMKTAEFLNKLEESFTVTQSDLPVSPKSKHSFGMYIKDGGWYLLEFKKGDAVEGDPVKNLDVSVLQDYLLAPLLNIKDPRTDDRIDFVGGIRGLKELEKRVAEDMEVAFSMKATSIDELMDVSDASLLMPPKSTWFEPKLRSGLFIHRI